MTRYKTISVVLAVILLAGCQPADLPDYGKQDNPLLADCPTVSTMPRSPKRGVSFNLNNLTDALLLSESISWYYNWGNAANGDAQVQTFLESCGIDFCPMCWSGGYNADRIRRYVAAHPGTRCLLGFNEPNLTDQANMTPQRAGELWPGVVRLAKELGLRLGAPAMNYGTLAGYSDPEIWLDEFFAIDSVHIEDIDFIPIHCYMTSASAVRSYVEKFAKYGKPIWMTEFCAWGDISSVEAQKTYMSDVLNYFESSPLVERYAWFIPRSDKSLGEKPYNQLLTKLNPVALTPLGEIFAGMSSQDTTVCIDASRHVPAVWYTRFSAYPTVTNSTDDTEQPLMLYNLSSGRWVEYQIDVPQPCSRLDLRYATSIDTQVAVYVDGDPQQMAVLPATGSMSTWQTCTMDNLQIEGKHCLKIHVLQGAMHLGWFGVH